MRLDKRKGPLPDANEKRAKYQKGTKEMLPDKQTADKIQARSRELDPRLERTMREGCGVYRVAGRTGTYTVTVSEAGFACDCTAGQNGKACWHSGSVYRLRLVEKMRRAQPVKPRLSGADLWGEETGCASCGWTHSHRANCAAVAKAS